MAKYIDLHNLKENLTNFLNKKIDPIYAKKTEVPQGTVVDDALSSTSTNPVQNKVVKAEFDKVNSNLDTLEFGEVAGGKNIAHDIEYTSQTEAWKCIAMGYAKLIQDIEYTMSFTVTSNGSGKIYIPSSSGFESGNPVININSGTTRITRTSHAIGNDGITKSIFVSTYEGNSATISITDFMIEEGDTATPYEPYIPSVKMLADENKKQSTEIMDTKMLGWSVPKECPIQNEVKGNQFVQKVGRADMSKLDWTTYSPTGIFRFSSQSEAEYTKYNIKQGSFAYLRDYNYVGNSNSWANINNYGNKTIMGVFVGGWDDGFILTNNSYTDSASFKKAMQGQYLYYELATPITKTIDGNEAVTQLKNDLSDLKDGTTPAAKAVADEDGNNIKSTYAKKTEAFIDYSHISVDLNTLTKAPSLISIGYDIDNKPPKFMGGYMLVVNAGYPASIALYQILFDVYYNKTYQRKYYHGSWSAWSDVTTPQDVETTTLTTTSGTATLYKLGKMRHLVLNDATFSSTAVLTSTDASVGSLYFRAEVLFNSGDDLEGGSASFEDICIGGSNMWNATRTATGSSPVAVKGATGSATWMV